MITAPATIAGNLKLIAERIEKLKSTPANQLIRTIDELASSCRLLSEMAKEQDR